ncbi:hypothetical protein GA0070606_1158 [Micromonospora citrea]|uniref:Uncharacterized protein n=1 Tax=Micromonospora citrea TaxID=47855 RepID=A0A1C6U080_9ACTN|nr:hypothetical protein [Micromonospora citrea]SCL47490.1 hypothetical protein GA0070606_1158 [Micromonospora citrea]
MRRTLAATAVALTIPVLAGAVAPPAATAGPMVIPDRGPAFGTSRPAVAPADMPATVYGGAWRSGHVQGVAVDWSRGHVYWSFTNVLVKTDLDGRVVGTVTGLTGHLGDLDLNPEDGRVYGSLEYKAERAFYIAIFDVTQITRVGMDAETDGVMTTVHLQEVVDDFTADLDGDGVFDGDTAQTADHRYGASGIDGVSFGPALGTTGGRNVLMVAYGIYPNTTRTDNDHQVLLAYDVRRWSLLARPLSQAAPHRSGPGKPYAKVFVRTGNTTYGVQNLEYDRHTRRWLMAVYRGSKPEFPNWTLYAIDGTVAPRTGVITGQPDGATGWTVPLAAAGLTDPGTGIRGWEGPGSFGLEALGDGRFYVVTSGTTTVDGERRQTGTALLRRWTGTTPDPFAAPVPAVAGRRGPARPASAG